MIVQKLSTLTIHYSDTSLENCMVPMHLEAQLQWVMTRSDKGCTTLFFMSLGDVSRYMFALLISPLILHPVHENNWNYGQFQLIKLA
uniref:Uncharacterized protein n=1 Tax=Arundo donax TaxID=35708 RepID=A0A0A9CBN6_ARUDO